MKILTTQLWTVCSPITELLENETELQDPTDEDTLWNMRKTRVGNHNMYYFVCQIVHAYYKVNET